MTIISTSSVIKTHVLCDGSISIIRGRAINSPESRLFNVVKTTQSSSLFCRQADSVNLCIGSYLSLTDLNAARLGCKWLHQLYSNPIIWSAWVARLRETRNSEVTPYAQVRNSIMAKVIYCLNQTLEPEPPFEEDEDLESSSLL